MDRPVIGVVPLWDESKDSMWMLPGYFAGIEGAGGIPLMLPLTDDPSVIRQIAGAADGLLFTGGQDVQPALYGQETLPACEEVCARRDGMERLLFAEALGRDLPVFGICRGIQLINVLLGGSLYQDILSQTGSPVAHNMRGPPYDRPAHAVSARADTPLRDLLGSGAVSVNSYHHQGIRDLAPPLAVMAEAPDGLAEAVYMPGKAFVWAVQWHPEFALGDPASRALFAAFVGAAARGQDGKAFGRNIRLTAATGGRRVAR
jgi:putative glutamine amidotransferase